MGVIQDLPIYYFQNELERDNTPNSSHLRYIHVLKDRIFLLK